MISTRLLSASSSVTGLDYFLARYYSGAQGRFTSPDEFQGGIVDPFTGQQVGQPGPLPYADITDPQTLNKYVYVRNNPLRYVDPDGHCIWDVCAVEAAAVTGAVAGTAGAVRWLQSPQGQESTRAFIQGASLLINKAVEGLQSLLPGSQSQQLPSANAPGTPAEINPPIATPGTPAESLPPVAPVQSSRSANDVKPDPNAVGAHSVPKRDASGKVIGYTTFNDKGGAVKRMDKVGSPHGGVGGVPTPHVHEAKPGKGPGAPLRNVRPARPDEIPK